MKDVDLRVISLGAGVQSSTMYLMACEGLFEDKPDCAIFADTQAEPPWVYEQLDYLRRAGSIPIHVVTAGNLETDVLRSRDGRSRFASIPLRVASPNGGKSSLLRRQCTKEYKIEPIAQKCREVLGLKPRQRAAGRYVVEQWIGISLDEARRAKESRYPWVVVHHPLLFERPMTRRQCLQWLKSNGHPVPLKSACYFCPYHDDSTWQWYRDEQPKQWARAVTFDREIRRGKLRGVNKEAYLHRSLKPLDEVDFSSRDDGQMQLFHEECEGMCGV